MAYPTTSDLIDVRSRLHTREHATFMISRQPWRGARPCARQSCASQLCLSPVVTMVRAALPVAAPNGLALQVAPWDTR
jgi:hypothetical protein